MFVGSVTVTPMEAEFPPIEAVTVAVPGATPRTTNSLP